MSFPGVPVHHIGASDRARLRAMAREAIEARMHGLRPPRIERLHVPASLWRPGASFVTLRRDGTLRGCIGTLEARRPLAVDVVDNAIGAATRDPRFEPLEADELDDLEMKISVLGAPEPLGVDDRPALLAALRPGIDGLTVQVGTQRATFLPAVWEQVPDAEDFVDQLWAKAGLGAGSWPAGLQLWRYGSEEF
jgi:uncharacterized protein